MFQLSSPEWLWLILWFLNDICEAKGSFACLFGLNGSSVNYASSQVSLTAAASEQESKIS